MGPRHIAHELAQEEPRYEHSSCTAADIGVAKPGERGLQGAAQVLGQGHGPERLAGLGGASGHLVAQRRRAHDTRHPIAQRDDLRPGKGRDIEHAVGLVLNGARQGVSHDQTALRISVGDLHRGAVAHRHNVAGALGVGRGHVLGQSQPGVHAHPQFQASRRQHCAQNGGRTGHVRLHLRHGGRRLE